MSTKSYTPAGLSDALRIVEVLNKTAARDLSQHDFIAVWRAVAYLNPGLHPDGYEAADSGWPDTLRPLAKEAWHRYESGKLADEELYPSDSAWSGLCTGMANP